MYETMGDECKDTWSEWQYCGECDFAWSTCYYDECPVCNNRGCLDDEFLDWRGR